MPYIDFHSFIHYIAIYTAQHLALIFFMLLVCVPRSHNYFGSVVQVLEGEGDGGTTWSVPENATESDLLFFFLLYPVVSALD